MVMMKRNEMIVPKQTTTPIGPHSGVLAITIGITPIDAAALVRKMGRIRR